jgi:hypothetical protein
MTIILDSNNANAHSACVETGIYPEVVEQRWIKEPDKEWRAYRG